MIAACNKLTLAGITDSVSGTVLEPGQTKTLMLLTWVEHDNIYRDDADRLMTAASDKTPTDLIGGGSREKVTEDFYLMFHIKQED